MEIREKIAWALFVITIGTCIYILFNSHMASKKNEFDKILHNLENELSNEEFLKIVQNEEYINIKLFYIPFSEVTGLFKEGTLFSDISWKIDMEHVAPVCHKYFVDLLKEPRVFEKTTVTHSNFRYCCLVRTKTNKHIRFSISHLYPNILFINGEPHKVSFEVIKVFLKLLPVQDYESAIAYYEEMTKNQSIDNSI